MARRYVIVSYFSPLSLPAFRRIVRGMPTAGYPGKTYTALNEVVVYFALSGFRPVCDLAQPPALRALHLSVFETV